MCFILFHHNIYFAFVIADFQMYTYSSKKIMGEHSMNLKLAVKSPDPFFNLTKNFSCQGLQPKNTINSYMHANNSHLGIKYSLISISVPFSSYR